MKRGARIFLASIDTPRAFHETTVKDLFIHAYTEIHEYALDPNFLETTNSNRCLHRPFSGVLSTDTRAAVSTWRDCLDFLSLAEHTEEEIAAIGVSAKLRAVVNAVSLGSGDAREFELDVVGAFDVADDKGMEELPKLIQHPCEVRVW